MFHLNAQVWLNSGQGRQEVIKNLFCGRAKFAAARADFQLAVFITVITLRPGLGADQDGITVVG
jgi:hypothetical protein